MFQDKNLAAVKNNSFFRGTNEKDLKFQLNLKNFSEIEEGEIIYQFGDPGDCIYLIIEGEIKLKIAGGLSSPIIIKKGKDDFFGEKEIQESSPRKSSAVANKNSLLYIIRKNDINLMIQGSKELRIKLYGIQKEDSQEGANKGDIVLNEPSKDLPGLPFFHKTREMTSLNKPDIKPKDNKETDIPEEPETEKGSVMEDLPDNYPDVDTYEELEKFEVEPTGEPETGSDNLLIDGQDIPLGNTFSPQSESEPNINNEIIKEVTEYKNEAPENDERLNWDLAEDSEKKPIVEPPVVKLPQLVNTIKKFFSVLKPEELFITLPDALCKLLDTEGGTLYLIDKETGEFRTWRKNGIEYTETRLKLPGNLFTESVNEKKIVSISYPPEEAGGENIKAGINNHLILPLLNKSSEPIGVIELTNKRKGPFNDQDESVLTELSPLIILALENSEYIKGLLHSDRLISLNKMANFLIQDIKNPIVTIKQYSEHIKKQEINPEIKPVLDMIIEQADSIVDLVHTTLGYSEGKIISKPQTILLTIALDSILALLAEYVESRNVKLFKKFDGDGLVNLDKKEFYQACFQIAKNACDAMPHGGNFYVITKRESDKIRIEFKDNGIGIPDSIKDRIFEPFMSHGNKDKTGLGLAIAEKIVKEHDGKIWAESDLGEGAVFIIVLPAVD
jgi:signal transduction histidine kinase